MCIAENAAAGGGNTHEVSRDRDSETTYTTQHAGNARCSATAIERGGRGGGGRKLRLAPTVCLLMYLPVGFLNHFDSASEGGRQVIGVGTHFLPIAHPLY